MSVIDRTPRPTLRWQPATWDRAAPVERQCIPRSQVPTMCEWHETRHARRPLLARLKGLLG